MIREMGSVGPSGGRGSARRIQVMGRQPYAVVVGAGVLSELERALPGGPAAVLTDTQVERLHVGRLGTCAKLPRLAVPPGEDSKSFATLERVLDFMLHARLDRRATLIAFGGGVVGDLGGLAAGLFMRGIDCVQCPTTLLAQVDSAVGGKTAVNLRAGKNLAGMFHPPRLVLSDTQTLATLPEEQLRSGLGEVVKSALLGDRELLELLERDAAALMARDAALLGEVVSRCVTLKAGIVGRDEHERHERKLLNLGHTFAHAIEQAAGYGRVPHGIAVGVGLVLALRASQHAGILREPELLTRIPRVLERVGMPAELAALRTRNDVRLAPEELVAAMRHDKKGRAERPSFVLVEGLGKLRLDQELDERALVELLS